MDDNQELEIKEKFKNFEEFKKQILNQKHYRTDFDYDNLSESELKSKSILGVIEPDIGKNGISVEDLISALPMVVRGGEYKQMSFWSEMAGELNNEDAQYLINIIDKYKQSHHLGDSARTELFLTFALKNEVAWNAFSEYLISHNTVSDLNLLQALSKTKEIRDEALPLMHQVFGKEFTDAYLENKELIDRTPRKGNFVDLLKENRYKITNFLDSFTEEVKILSEDFGEDRYDYECLSKALEKEGFREASGKLFATMLNEKEEYALSYENYNSNAFIRKMFPEVVEKLEENYTLNLTREKLEDISNKSFKQAQLLRELRLSPYSKILDNSVDGRLITDIMKAQPDNLEQIIKAYNIFYKLNGRPETYGSSYNSLYPNMLMLVVKRDLPEWMYPVIAEAVKRGVVSSDRLGNTENLFDAAKAWKINPKIWKKDAEKIGRMSLEARIVAGVIFDNISEQERDKTKQEKRELFWSKMKEAQNMGWRQIIALYGKDNIKTKGRMLSLIFDNQPEDEFSKKLRVQLNLTEILNIKPERITEALNFIGKDELLKEENIAFFVKKINNLPDEKYNNFRNLLKSKVISNQEKVTILKILPISDLAEFNYGNYIKIKKDLLDSLYLSDKKRYGEEKAASPEELFSQNAEWLIPSAAAFNVLYKKNYKSYLDVINRYNEMLPKLKEKMPKVEEEASIKTDKLQKQLDEIIKEKNKHDTRILGLTPDDPNYADERRKFDEITRQERGINGQLTSIKNYVDYNQQEPISIEHALSWMPKALLASNREGMLKCINSNLIAYNPNIQACGKKGQPILRLSAVDYDYSGGYRKQVINNEISIVSARWNMLPENIKHLSFKEIFNLASSLQYSGKDIEFQKANCTYIDDQDEYDRAEEIYLKGKLTPSRFKTGKMYYSDDKSWRCFIAPKDDPRVLYAGGNFTDRGHCCQSYDDVGSDCAVDSVTNPDSGCVIFERNMGNDKENPCWEMLGCSWLYETENNGYKNLVFDNVEIHDSYQSKSESTKYNQAFDGLVDSLKNENYRSITIGLSPDLSRDLESSPQKNPLPWGYLGYSDAKSHQDLIHFNPNAKPEKLPQQMIVGFDYDMHFSGVQKVAKATNKSDYSPLENVDEDTKGMVLIDRNKQILGYVLWNEDENGENEVCNLAVVPQSRKGEISGSVMLMSEFMRQIKNVKGNWSACVDKDVGLRLLKAMAANVSGGEKADIPQDYSGRGLIDLNIINSQGKDMYNVEFKIRDIANNEEKQNAARDIEQNDILKAISQNNHDR